MLLGCLLGSLLLVALVDIGQVHTLPCRLLHCLGQPADFRPILGVSRRDMQRQKMTQRVDRQMVSARWAAPCWCDAWCWIEMVAASPVSAPCLDL